MNQSYGLCVRFDVRVQCSPHLWSLVKGGTTKTVRLSTTDQIPNRLRKQVDNKQNTPCGRTQKHSQRDHPEQLQQHRCRKTQDKLPEPERERGNVPVQSRRGSIKQTCWGPNHNRKDFTQGGEAVSPRHTSHSHTHRVLVSYLLVSSQGFQLKWLSPSLPLVHVFTISAWSKCMFVASECFIDSLIKTLCKETE